MKKELKYIIVEYTNKDLGYIEELCKHIESLSDEIIQFFNIEEFGEKIYIKIFDDIGEFRKFYCTKNNKYQKVDEIPKWVCGFAKDSKIYTLCLEEYKKTQGHEKNNLSDLKHLVMHEFTHACHGKVSNNRVCAWLSEGLATTISHQYDNEEKIFNFTLDQAINGGPNYRNYYTMFSYVLENYGRDYILELITNPEILKRDTIRLYEETKNFYGETEKRR